MKKFLILFAFVFMSIDCFAATPRPSGRTPGANTAAPAANNANTAVRAARGAPVVRGGNVAAPVQNVSVSRSATTPAARSATTPTAGKVTARAAKQNAIVGGTKVAAAGQNTVVDDACRAKFDGCMDSFCMLDNANGGRCLCSDRSKELNTVLLEIEKLDNQSYKMATAGVEKIEMGEDGDAVLASADAATKAVLGEDNTKTKRRALDLTAWNKSTDFDSADEFDLFGASSDENSVEGKEGDALYNASYKLCQAQMPECASSMNMLTALYKQRVRSDCVAYENSLKKQRDASAQKLAAAETALREAALEQYRSANKYDLGQCTIEFKQCMKTTAGCGDDFSGCATVAATAEAQTKSKSTKKVSKQYAIKGPSVTISIAAATYDTLDAKKPLCMNVTKNCVNVRDQVWDAFLREVAPELKSAELIAESNLRESCIENISSCFQKACKDNLDPNDPDGSYDICLSRPQALESFCKVQIQPCQAAYPSIMEDSILPRLASIRTDACTKEFKECLTSEDRCGEDYSQCIGLDTDTIIAMCPKDKLTACYYEYNNNTESVEQAINRLATGIFNNIDSQMQEICTNAAYKRYVEICGESGGCEPVEENTNLGTGSLRSSKSQASTGNNAGNITIDGKVMWGAVALRPNETITVYNNNIEYYNINGNYNQNNDNTKDDRIKKLVLGELHQEIERWFQLLVSDPTVAMCVTGRDISQIDRTGRSTNSGRTQARFPHLLDTYSSLIANAVIQTAQNNYNRKYSEFLADAVSETEDYRNQIKCSRMALTGDEQVDALQIASTNSEKLNGAKFETQRTTYSASDSKNFLPDAIADGSVIRDNDWETVINGANTNQLREAMTMQNYSERAMFEKISTALKEVKKRVDKRGATEDEPMFIGKQSVRAVYESGPKVCRITTTTTMCSGLGQVSDSKSVDVGGGVSLPTPAGSVGVNANVGVSMSTYKGSVCTAFDEPIISEQLINMKNNQVIQGNITRSNVTTKITDNSSVINDNSRDFSLGGLSTGSIGNRGNIDNSSMSGDAMRIGGTNTATGNTNTSNKSQKESKKKNEVASTPKTSSGGGAGGYGMSGRNSGNMMNNITGGLMPQ